MKAGKQLLQRRQPVVPPAQLVSSRPLRHRLCAPNASREDIKELLVRVLGIFLYSDKSLDYPLMFILGFLTVQFVMPEKQLFSPAPRAAFHVIFRSPSVPSLGAANITHLFEFETTLNRKFRKGINKYVNMQ